MPPKHYTIDDCKRFAEAKGGKCLSTKYINNSTKLQWECSEGHTWWAHWNNIKDSGTWCYYCHGNVKLTIEECRRLGGLELDGYCEEEKFAMEYQGRQHYEYNAHFHRTETAFKEQQERDARKKEILKERGINLLEIPYTYSYLNESISSNTSPWHDSGLHQQPKFFPSERAIVF